MIDVASVLKSSLRPQSLINYNPSKKSTQLSKDLFYMMQNSETIKELEEAAKEKERIIQIRMKRLK